MHLSVRPLLFLVTYVGTGSRLAPASNYLSHARVGDDDVETVRPYSCLLGLVFVKDEPLTPSRFSVPLGLKKSIHHRRMPDIYLQVPACHISRVLRRQEIHRYFLVHGQKQSKTPPPLTYQGHERQGYRANLGVRKKNLTFCTNEEICFHLQQGAG